MSQRDTIPFEGEFNCWTRDFDLPDLIFSICRPRKTGLLRFVSAEAEKSLFIRGGEIVFATSSSPDDRLGEYLLRAGRVRLNVLTEVSKEVHPGRRFGAILVARGVLSEAEAKRAVIEHVEFIVKSLFRWTDAWYGFNEQELPGQENITIETRTVKLILEGVRQIDSWRRILKGVGDLSTLYQLAPGQEASIRGLDLDAQSLAILTSLRRPRPVETICASSEVHDFEVCRLLWVFRSLGLITQPLVDEPVFPMAEDEAAFDSEPVTAPGSVVVAGSVEKDEPLAKDDPFARDEPFAFIEEPPAREEMASSPEVSFADVPGDPFAVSDEAPPTLPRPVADVPDVPDVPDVEDAPEEAAGAGLYALPLPPESDYSFTAPRPKPTMVVTDLPFPIDGAPTIDLSASAPGEVVEDMSEIIITADGADIPFAMPVPDAVEEDLGLRPVPAELSVGEADPAQREADLAFALGGEEYGTAAKPAPPPAGFDPDLDLEGLGMVLGGEKE